MSRQSASILEWDVHKSDRIELIDSAVNVLSILTTLKMNGGEDAWAPERELDHAEENLYRSALTLLASEFDLGPREAESHMSRSTECTELDDDQSAFQCGGGCDCE
jgi:hypothetical protein